MPRSIRILRWLNMGVVLFCLLGVNRVERALAITEKVLGPEHPDSAASRISSEGILLELTIPSLS